MQSRQHGLPGAGIANWAVMSAFDPKRTSGGSDLRVACLFMDNRCLRAFAHQIA